MKNHSKQKQVSEQKMKAEVNKFIGQGDETKVLEVLIKAFLVGMGKADIHVRDPLELAKNEDGREFLSAWAVSFPRFFAFQRPGVMQPYPLSAEPQASLA
ncbi:hypothetical protein LGN04_29825 [Burkholderia multivorans]|nr:hypothetical protein [Burkholderia multivorans]